MIITAQMNYEQFKNDFLERWDVPEVKPDESAIRLQYILASYYPGAGRTGISSAKLSNELNIPQPTAYRLVDKDALNPTFDIIVKLAQKNTDLSLEWLIRGKGDESIFVQEMEDYSEHPAVEELKETKILKENLQALYDKQVLENAKLRNEIEKLKRNQK